MQHQVVSDTMLKWQHSMHMNDASQQHLLAALLADNCSQNISKTSATAADTDLSMPMKARRRRSLLSSCMAAS
jgi:hypothetical protein